MILGFHKQFESLILDGSKIHTIREDKNNRWEAGRVIQFATGVRTKNYRCFKTDICKSIQNILLVNHGNHVYCQIQINDNLWVQNDCVDFDNKPSWKPWKKGGKSLLTVLCANDGLTYDDFKKWFIPNHGDKFEGKIIHWTNFRYESI